MKKRLIAALVAISMLIPVFGGCMSQEEKEVAANNVVKAGPVVEQYLADFYPGARLDGMQTLIRATTGLFIVYYATDLVHANVILADGGRMEVICDLGDNSCYDTSNAQALEDAVRARIKNKVSNLGSPDEIEINYYSARLAESLDEKPKLYGFVPRGVTTAEQLLTEEFTVLADVKYNNSGIALDACNPIDFFTGSNARISFTDYVGGRFNSISDDYYCANQTLVYSCSKDDDESKPEYSSEFNAYSRAVVNGVEYAWNPRLINVSLSEESAPETVVTQYYSGAPFHSADGKLTRLSVTPVSSGTEQDNNNSRFIFVFFSSECSKRDVITCTDGEYDCWTIDWKEEDHYYRWISLFNFTGEKDITLGFYNRENS